jgi:hypothetical protein
MGYFQRKTSKKQARTKQADRRYLRRISYQQATGVQGGQQDKKGGIAQLWFLFGAGRVFFIFSTGRTE